MKLDPESGGLLAHWSEVPVGARVAARSHQGIERADVVRFLRGRASGLPEFAEVQKTVLTGLADEVARGLHKLDPVATPACAECGGPLAGAATGLFCPSKGCRQG